MEQAKIVADDECVAKNITQTNRLLESVWLLSRIGYTVYH